jgi:hypothetical protein
VKEGKAIGAAFGSKFVSILKNTITNFFLFISTKSEFYFTYSKQRSTFQSKQ